MKTALMHELAKKYAQKRPDIAPGYTVRVHERIKEGEKERIQIFEGLIIGMHRGHSPTDTTFTVRRVASGIGIEKIFPLHSPLVSKIDVKKVAKVRRAKLNFLRGRLGKSARMSERFTSAEEFAIAVAPPTIPQPEQKEEPITDEAEKEAKKEKKE